MNVAYRSSNISVGHILTVWFVSMAAACGHDSVRLAQSNVSHSEPDQIGLALHSAEDIKRQAEGMAPRTGFYAIDGSMAKAADKNLIWYLYDRANVKVKDYNQGVQLFGADSGKREKMVMLKICNDWRNAKIDQVAIVGYSRGGAIAARVAWRLIERGCSDNIEGIHARHPVLDLIGRSNHPKVRFLGMLDAVNSQTGISSETTKWIHHQSPSTVCYHYRKHGFQDALSRPFYFGTTHFQHCDNRVHPDPSANHGDLAKIDIRNGQPQKTRILGRFWDQFHTHGVIGDAAASSQPSALHFCSILPDTMKASIGCPGSNGDKSSGKVTANQRDGCYVKVDNCSDKVDMPSGTWFRDEYDGASRDADRCMRRASEFANWCNNAKTASVYFVADGMKVKTTSSQKDGCYVNVDNCSDKNGMPSNMWFRDEYDGASRNADRCMRRASEFANWCDNAKMASVYYSVDGIKIKNMSSKKDGCYVRVSSCQAHPAVIINQYFRDDFQGSSADLNRCMDRAKDYFDWCQPNKAATVYFLKDGKKVKQTSHK